jgi:hypothetical protein
LILNSEKSISDTLVSCHRINSSFSSALDEVANARVFGGIHFRFSTQDAQASGTAVGKYVVENAFQRQDRRDYDDDDIDE